MIRVSGRMRPFLRVVVVVALTHVRETNGFPNCSKTAVSRAHDIIGLPLDYLLYASGMMSRFAQQ